jgi:hypothetical protein
LEGERHLHEIVATAVVAPPTAPRLSSDLLTIEVPAPAGVEDGYGFRDGVTKRHSPSKKDYLAIQARNASLGLEGDRLAFRFEHERLWAIAYTNQGRNIWKIEPKPQPDELVRNSAESLPDLKEPDFSLAICWNLRTTCDVAKENHVNDYGTRS